MNPTSLESPASLDHTRTNVERTTGRRRRNKKRVHQAALFLFTLSLWCGLLYGGYWLANRYIEDSQAYIDRRIEEVKDVNAKQMALVVSELEKVQQELRINQEELAFADETINGSNQTKQALQERMTQLDKKLAELKVSLQNLEDAIRVP